MSDISKITLPSGNTYNIKDAVAREAIAKLQNIENILSVDAATTPYGITWLDNESEVVGTLVADANTIKKKKKKKKSSNDDIDEYDEYLTLKIGNNYEWEKIGSTKTDLGNLGNLAYKSSASASYQPAGEINDLNLIGTESSINLSINNNINGNYQPTGSIGQPEFQGSTSTFSGSISPTGTIGIQIASTQNKTAAVSSTTGTVTYTPAGSCQAPAISIKNAGSTDTIQPVTSIGTLPSLTMSVSNEILSVAFSSGTLPVLGTAKTFKTGDASYTASSPTFSGTGVRLVTGNIAVPSAITGTFYGDSTNVSVSGTPNGSITAISFTGTTVQIEGTVSPLGSISKPEFTGTTASIVVT